MTMRIVWVVVGLVVLGFVGYLGWQWFQRSQAAKPTADNMTPAATPEATQAVVPGAGARFAGGLSPQHQAIADATSEITLIP